MKRLWDAVRAWLVSLGEYPILKTELRCLHGNDLYTCHVLCGGCADACNLHMPECRNVKPQGSNTRDWYCHCARFV